MQLATIALWQAGEMETSAAQRLRMTAAGVHNGERCA